MNLNAQPCVLLALRRTFYHVDDSSRRVTNSFLTHQKGVIHMKKLLKMILSSRIARNSSILSALMIAVAAGKPWLAA